MLSLLCPQGNAANEASCSALSLKKQIWSPNSASNQKCNLGKLLSLLGLDFLSAKLGKERETNAYDRAIYVSHQRFMYG